MRSRSLLPLLFLLGILFTNPPLSIADEHAHDAHDEHDSHEEAQLELSDKTLVENEISVGKVEQGLIEEHLSVIGNLTANDDRVAHVMPRFSGVLKEVRKSVGDTVQKGEVLAIIESNQNLQLIEMKPLISGTVIKRHATLGELLSDNEEAFIVADLSELWADFFVFSADFSKIKIGQTVRLSIPDSKTEIEAKLSYVSSVVDESTQSKLVRAVLPNQNGNLYPGLFVKGNIILSTSAVPRAVYSSAIQNIEGKSVVFKKHGAKFEPVEVAPGRTDGIRTEINSGLETGENYAFGNTFILKAEVQKGSAEHEH